MKNNFIKYVFIIFVIILAVFAVYKINKEESSKQENTNNIQEVATQNIATDLRLAIVNYDSINPILSNNSNVQDISRLVFEPLVTMEEEY